MSLIGDQFVTVTRQIGVGSSLDRNIHQPIPLSDAFIDGLASAVATLRVMRTSNEMASFITATGDTKDATHPWDSLNANEKFRALQDVIGKSVTRAAQTVLAN